MTDSPYHCLACGTVKSLHDLNDDMLCVTCGEPDEDPDDCEPSADELFRDERTWGV